MRVAVSKKGSPGRRFCAPPGIRKPLTALKILRARVQVAVRVGAAVFYSMKAF